jgi:competence protein ComEC
MRPLIYVAAAFISGIILSGGVELPILILWAFLALSVLALIALRLLRLPFSYLYIVPVFFFLGAVFIVPYLGAMPPAGHIADFTGSFSSSKTGVFLGVDVEGVVAEVPELRRTRTRIYVDAELVHTPDGAVPTFGRVMLTVLESLPTLRKGDRVRFLAPLTRPWNYGNPGEFDYRSWLMMRGVHVTGFIKSPRFIKRAGGALDPASGFNWVSPTGAERDGGAGISAMREGIRRVIDSSGARNAGALKALITGDKHAVDPALREAFRTTGTAHLMAISGLHVGMVAFFSFSALLFIARSSERLMLAVDVRKTALLTRLRSRPWLY